MGGFLCLSTQMNAAAHPLVWSARRLLHLTSRHYNRFLHYNVLFTNKLQWLCCRVSRPPAQWRQWLGAGRTLHPHTATKSFRKYTFTVILYPLYTLRIVYVMWNRFFVSISTKHSRYYKCELRIVCWQYVLVDIFSYVFTAINSLKLKRNLSKFKP